MTTVKEVCDQFKIPERDRYSDLVENINIGDYTFTDMNDDMDLRVTDFTNKNNPNIILRINHDRAVVTLFKILNDTDVDVTSWRYGDKVNKIFPRTMFHI